MTIARAISELTVFSTLRMQYWYTRLSRQHTGTPTPSGQKILSNLHKLQKWSLAVRGEQLLHLLHTSNSTV